MNLSDKEFWSLTPHQLSLLSARRRQQLEWWDYRFALLDSLTVNYAMRGPDKDHMTSPSDFMPSYRKQKPRQQQPLSDDELAHQINAVLRPRSIPKKKA